MNKTNNDMEFKGTKGPWKQNGNNGIHTKEGSCIALTYGENRNPNAKLISKAPEMLEMLNFLNEACVEEASIRDKVNKLIKEATEL